jgi:hypothetical protein
MLPPCLIILDGDGPADPLVARERRYVFPGRQCLRVGGQRLPEISRKIMYDSLGDSNCCHGVISQAKGSSIRYVRLYSVTKSVAMIKRAGAIRSFLEAVNAWCWDGLVLETEEIREFYEDLFAVV